MVCRDHECNYKDNVEVWYNRFVISTIQVNYTGYKGFNSKILHYSTITSNFYLSKYLLKQQTGLQICCVNNLMNSKNVDWKLHFNHIIHIEKITTNISTDILRYPQHQCR